MVNRKLWPYANVLLLLVTLIVNGLANGLPLNGQTTASISDKFPVLFVPAGYVFAIWGLIYIGLIAFGVFQALPGQRASIRLSRIDPLFATSCALNATWIFMWHYNLFPLSLAVMVGLLLCLIGIYLRLDIGRTPVGAVERWMQNIPFSIYLGWITVATIANTSDVLYYFGWNGQPFGPEIWFVVVLVAAVAIASAVALTRGDIAYMLVILWAFVGIAVKQAAIQTVAYTTWAFTVVVAVMLVVGWWLNRRRTTALMQVRAG